MEVKNKQLKKRIIEISYKNKLSHIGSCLTAVDIIEEIYSIKKPNEKFVLSSGHAGLALYCVLEKYAWKFNPAYEFKPRFPDVVLDAEKIFKHHGVHPDRCEECHLDCSAGSLGQGLPIAVGMALADRSKNIYCLISDGECSEGSIWEALRIASEQELTNLKIYCNSNGWAAYKELKRNGAPRLMARFKVNDIETNVEQLPFLQGQDAHYYIMKEEDYKVALGVLG